MRSIRAFVSIAVPESPELDKVRAELEASGARASPQAHITLSFIGDIDESKVCIIEECVRSAVSGIGPFRVILSGLGAFPNTKNPSVIWVGASPSDVLGTIARRLEANLTEAGIDHDKKPFKAHVTVGRCRDGLRRPVQFDKERVFSEFECVEALVMKSELGKGGARHTVLSRIPL